MKIYDIAMTLRPDMVVWPGDEPYEISPDSQISQGADANTSKLSFGSHAGTHVDAPRHFIENATSIDQIDLHRLIGPAQVLDCTGARVVDAEMLAGRLKPDVIPLLKTDSSDFSQTMPFRDDYVYLTPDGARALVDGGVKAFGIDYLSIGGGDTGTEVHRIILQAGLVAIEGLRLAEVPPGRYTLVCLPLKIKNGDGAPARAVLLEM